MEFLEACQQSSSSLTSSSPTVSISKYFNTNSPVNVEVDVDALDHELQERDNSRRTVSPAGVVVESSEDSEPEGSISSDDSSSTASSISGSGPNSPNPPLNLHSPSLSLPASNPTENSSSSVSENSRARSIIASFGITESRDPDNGHKPSHVSLLGGKYLLFLSPQGPGTDSTGTTTTRINSTTTTTLNSPRVIQKCVNIETREQFMCKILPRTADGLGLLATYSRLSGFSDLVTPIREVIMGPKLFYLILPPNHGNVHAYLLAKKRLREEEAVNLFKQMVKAVEYCHSKGIILRDLKLGKFVFVDKARTIIRLESLEDTVLLENESDDGLGDKHGCPNYVSPEKAEILRCNNKRYPGKATDIWGLGIMLYTMLVGRYPFNDTEHAKLFAKIRKGTVNIPEQLSVTAKCLIRCLLRKDPSSRLTLKEIKMHPWITRTDKNNSNVGKINVYGSCGTQISARENLSSVVPPNTPSPPVSTSPISDISNAKPTITEMETDDDDQVVPDFGARI